MTEGVRKRWIGFGLLLLSIGLLVADVGLSGTPQKTVDFGAGVMMGASVVLVTTGRWFYLPIQWLSSPSARQ